MILEDLKQRVCREFKISIRELEGQSRQEQFCIPRQVVMYIAREYFKLPYSAIATSLSRDHTTVISGVRSIQSRLDSKNEQRLNDSIAAIKKSLGMSCEVAGRFKSNLRAMTSICVSTLKLINQNVIKLYDLAVLTEALQSFCNQTSAGIASEHKEEFLRYCIELRKLKEEG